MKQTTSLGEMARYTKGRRFSGLLLLAYIAGLILIVNVGSQDCDVSEHQPETATEYESEFESESLSSTVEPSRDQALVGESNDAETISDEQIEAEPYVRLSEGEITALARLIWLEGGCESVECQEAIASVVINRYTIGRNKYQDLFDVIYEPKQFSPAHNVEYTELRELQLSIANKIVTEGPTIPEYVTFFRSTYFHSWGDQVPYICIDNTYFSYSASFKEKVENSEVIK